MAHKHGGKVPESPPDIRDHVWPLLKKELKVIIRRVQELNLEMKNNNLHADMRNWRWRNK